MEVAAYQVRSYQVPAYQVAAVGAPKIRMEVAAVRAGAVLYLVADTYTSCNCLQPPKICMEVAAYQVRSYQVPAYQVAAVGAPKIRMEVAAVRAGAVLYLVADTYTSCNCL